MPERQRMSTHVLLSIPEACDRLQLGRTTVYDLIRSGELASVSIGRRRLIPADALTNYVSRLTEAASA